MSQKAKINPNAGHRSRLKERLLQDSHGLGDHELIELLIGYVYSRQDTKPLAKKILSHFGSLRGLFSAKSGDLEQFAGTKKGLVIAITLFRELMSRYAEAPVIQRQELANPNSVAQMARMRLGSLEHEECWIALVDTQNKLVAWEMVSRGNMENIPIQPKDVFAIALKYKCSGFILVHNHPSGGIEPSTPDIEFTNKIKELSIMIGLRFIDHIIVTESDCYSFMKNKLL